MHSNTTPNYHFPQFLGTDNPEFIGDFNPAFSEIDEVLKVASVNSETASTSAGTAIATAQSAQNTANTATQKADTAQGGVNTLATNLSALTTRVSATEENNILINGKLGGLTFVKLTQSAYDEITVKNPNTIYFVIAE